jgi:hypothetical protein
VLAVLLLVLLGVLLLVRSIYHSGQLHQELHQQHLLGHWALRAYPPPCLGAQQQFLAVGRQPGVAAAAAGLPA